MSHCYYTRTATEALTDTQSSEQGLTAADVNARLARDGENILPKSQTSSKLWRLLRQFHNVLIYVLLAGLRDLMAPTAVVIRAGKHIICNCMRPS